MKREREFGNEVTFRFAVEDRQAASPSPSDETADVCEILDFNSAKWSWSCRHLFEQTCEKKCYVTLEQAKPRPADLALVRIEKLGRHHVVETENKRLRLYEGDRLVCVFGNRYATDVYEGVVLDLKRLHLLTASGIIGTVRSRHRRVRRPTKVSFLGYLADSSGRRVNLKELGFRPVASKVWPANVIVVLGTGMNTGKTTVAAKILRALVSRGFRVAGCKLTGSASPRDLNELRATGAVHVADFSDYGFPSTYEATLAELLQLFDNMLDACSQKDARVVIMEVADGFLQRETQMLLDSPEFRQRVSGTVLAAACSGSALCAVDHIQRTGLDVWTVSGLITNSPLFVREFSSRSSIPVASSRGAALRLSDLIMKRIGLMQVKAHSPEVGTPVE